ncbi:MAG: hypothetical protein WBQ25_24750 [Nitrososphaeraceae archaeon]
MSTKIRGLDRTTPSSSGTTTTTSSTERGATTPTTSTPKTPVLPQIVAPVITIPKSISSLPETSNLTKFGSSSHGGSNSDGNGDSETVAASSPTSSLLIAAPTDTDTRGMLGMEDTTNGRNKLFFFLFTL